MVNELNNVSRMGPRSMALILCMTDYKRTLERLGNFLNVDRNTFISRSLRDLMPSKWKQHSLYSSPNFINTLRPRRIEQHFADDIFKRIFFNENVWISIEISLKFVPEDPINNIPALVQIMAWRRSGDKPLSESMTVSLPTHICVTRPQWVKGYYDDAFTSITLNDIPEFHWPFKTSYDDARRLSFIVSKFIDITTVRPTAFLEKYQWSALLTICKGITSVTVDSPHKWQATQKVFGGHDIILIHDDVIKWKHFPRHWPFVRVIHRSRWIPHTKASDAELCCFLWSAPE